MTAFALLALFLILLRAAAQYGLSRLNAGHVAAHQGAVPAPFRDLIDQATYTRSVDYTLAKARLGQVEIVFDTVLLLLVLFSGLLPWIFSQFSQHFGLSAWAMAACLFTVGILLSLPGLPFEWHAQFRLEERFGFNTSTQRLWWLDRLKGLLLALVLGYPLLVLILRLVEWTGTWWWLWAWGCLFAFQLLLMVLAPVFILPLFNKLTPLPEGPLRARLLALGERTGFHAKTILVMDGSKRSRHSNAFFTGFGRFRKIVLFDTLIQQLTETELAAVLAHEIGHYKRGHIPKLLAWSAFSSLLGFYLLSVLAYQGWFVDAFGFGAWFGLSHDLPNLTPSLLLFALLSGTVTFWLSPLGNHWSRKHEYEADAFASQTMGETQSLTGALRKLNEKNLSNLTPHPWYSGFYYSHPTLLEREEALTGLSNQ
jgi:STE24 endopeptidase